MKRVLLFLTLFGAGFAVLWLMRAQAPSPDKTPDLITQPADKGEFSQINVPSGKEGGGTSAIDISARGALDFERAAAGAASRLPSPRRRRAPLGVCVTTSSRPSLS